MKSNLKDLNFDQLLQEMGFQEVKKEVKGIDLNEKELRRYFKKSPKVKKKRKN